MPEHPLSALGDCSAVRLTDAERKELRLAVLRKITGEKTVRSEPDARLSRDMDRTKSLITGLKDQRQLLLNANEKSAMFETLRMKTRERAPAPVPPAPFFSMKWLKLATAFGVFLVGISGAAAAEFSLPGQLLYPVKIHVNENVRASVNFTTTSRASWNVARTERRLKEAETLAGRSQLTKTLAADIGARISADASATERSIAQVKHEGKVAAAVELSNRFRTSLETKRDALRRIADSDEPSRPAVQDLLVSVSVLTEPDGETALKEPKQKTEMEMKIESSSNTTGVLSIPAAKTAIKAVNRTESILGIGVFSSSVTSSAQADGGAHSLKDASASLSIDAKSSPGATSTSSSEFSSSSSSASETSSSKSSSSEVSSSSTSSSSSTTILPPAIDKTVDGLLGH